MIDTNQLSALISAFSVETEKESISPELFAARKLHVMTMIRECHSPKNIEPMKKTSIFVTFAAIILVVCVACRARSCNSSSPQAQALAGSIMSESDEITALMEDGKLQYIVYTGALKDATVGDYRLLHRRAMQLSIPCLTSTDTANALAQIIESRFTIFNTELVDINAMRPWRHKIGFAKMQTCGNDYIFIENFDGMITCPESLCVDLCAPHYGIGGDGIVLIEKSRIADAKMRSFNRDGSEGRMAGNNIRCVAKYLYDKGYVRSEYIKI